MSNIIEFEQILDFNKILSYISNQFQTNQFFSAAVVFGTLQAYGKKILEGILWCFNRIYRKIFFDLTIYETDELYYYFEKWLYKNYATQYRSVEATVKEIEDKNREITVSEDEERKKFFSKSLKIRQLTDVFLIRRKYSFIRIWKGREKLENASSLKSVYLNQFELSGIFVKKQILKLLEEIIEYNKELERNKPEDVKVYVNRLEYWNKFKGIDVKNFDRLFFEQKSQIIKDLKLFYSKEDWYKERSIPYKRGILLYGPPGTGKTSICGAIAKMFRKNLYVLNLSNMTDNELIEAYSKLPKNSILVVEDIDSMFDNEDSRKIEGEMNFSTLLNCIDGTFSKHGVVTIFTTNHKEKLDHAILRSGRMDKKYFINYPSVKHISKFVSFFYNDYEIDERSFFEVENKSIPMSRIQEICIENKDSSNLGIKRINEILEKL